MSRPEALSPVQPGSKDKVNDGPQSPQESQEEIEKKSKWIVRKLVGSLTGRLVVSAYESLRATGTSVVCLSPWGDSSLVTLPCIRFRDVVVHTVIAATGGMAAVAAPAMEPMSEMAAMAIPGENIIVHVVVKGFATVGNEVNTYLTEKPLEMMLKKHGKALRTEAVHVLLITLKYKHAGVEEAALGFFRSSIHGDPEMFSAVKDYFRIEKGWFSPYLFASSRRPDIPRSMQPDVIFCHGPFLHGDYKVGETLLASSSCQFVFCAPPAPPPPPPPTSSSAPVDVPLVTSEDDGKRHHRFSDAMKKLRLHHSDDQKADGALAGAAVVAGPPPPRRMVILLVGIKPHRGLWATSKRPSESVLKYILCDGPPAIVVPAKAGAPLVAWHGMTLEKLWAFKLPEEGPKGNVEGVSRDATFDGVVDILFEFLDICVMDWERVDGVFEGKDKKEVVKEAVRMLVTAAVQTRESKEVKKEIDEDRCGIAMWRIP